MEHNTPETLTDAIDLTATSFNAWREERQWAGEWAQTLADQFAGIRLTPLASRSAGRRIQDNKVESLIEATRRVGEHTSPDATVTWETFEIDGRPITGCSTAFVDGIQFLAIVARKDRKTLAPTAFSVWSMATITTDDVTASTNTSVLWFHADCHIKTGAKTFEEATVAWPASVRDRVGKPSKKPTGCPGCTAKNASAQRAGRSAGTTAALEDRVYDTGLRPVFRNGVVVAHRGVVSKDTEFSNVSAIIERSNPLRWTAEESDQLADLYPYVDGPVTEGSAAQVLWRCGKVLPDGNVCGAETYRPAYSVRSGRSCSVCTHVGATQLSDALSVLNADLRSVGAATITAHTDIPTTHMPAGSSQQGNFSCSEGHQWTHDIGEQIRNGGCPLCQDDLFERDTTIYLLSNGEGRSFGKFGIAVDLAERMAVHIRVGEYPNVVGTITVDNRREAFDIETFVNRKVASYRANAGWSKASPAVPGHTESFPAEHLDRVREWIIEGAAHINILSSTGCFK